MISTLLHNIISKLIWERIRKNYLLYGIATFSLFLLTVLYSTVFMLNSSLSDYIASIRSQIPDAIIQSYNQYGQQPIDIEQTRLTLQEIPGIISIQGRLWTVSNENDQFIKYTSSEIPYFEQYSFVIDKTVQLPQQKMRNMLQLPDSLVTDIGIFTHHPQEINALLPELYEALPFKAKIITKEQFILFLKTNASSYFAYENLILLSVAITLLGLILVISNTSLSGASELTIYRAVGWNYKSIFTLQFWQALIIGVPIFLVGIVIAYTMIFLIGYEWWLQLFVTWPIQKILQGLSISTLLLVVYQTFSLILLPWLTVMTVPVVVAFITQTKN